MTDVFTAPHFRDDNEARKVLEAILWPDGPVCEDCCLSEQETKAELSA
jgi:hypothetical protein